MLLVAFGPLIDASGFDFNLLPFAWHKTIGFMLNFSGFIFALLALKEMRKSFTVFVNPNESGSLVKTGVFSLCRNPIYFAGILMCFGWSISFKSPLSLYSSIFLIFILLWKVSYEEVELSKKFGDDYLRYKESTSKLIPFIF